VNVDRFRTVSLGRRVGLALAVMVGLVGFACSGGPPMGRVSGTVKYQGKPLDSGTITFISTDGQRPNATGSIDAQGYYRLQTAEPGDGALVGEYKVAITDVNSESYNTELPGAPLKTPPKSALPKKYQDANTSGLTAKVVSGGNTIPFDLQ